MNKILLELLITSLIGSGIMVNTNMLQAEDAINSAKSAANAANVHQFATVLELYYSDHNAYPQVANGPAMIDELYTQGYIRSKPLDSTVFQYSAKAEGQDYSLTLQ
jgi:hypothetical protein